MSFRIRCFAGLCAVLAAGTAARAQSFQVLGVLIGPGAHAQAHGVSANGQYTAGQMIDPDTGSMHAVVWNAAGQPMILAPYGSINIAHGVDDSGLVVPGESDGIGMVWGGEFGGGDAILGPGAALDVTPDGRNTIGYMQFAPNASVGFWRLSIGAIIILVPAGSDESSAAYGTTPDATRFVGASSRVEGTPPNEQFFSCAAVWTEGTPVCLAPLPGGTISQANAVSSDGSVVVGFGDEGGPTTAVRWANGVPTSLTPGEFSNALDVSADGQVVVGEDYDGAFVWDPVNGLRPLRQLLIDAGHNLNNYTLIAARSVSADGSIIVGWGFQLDPFTEIGWRIDINGSPPPCAADFNDDDVVNSQDFFDFLTAFFASDPAADFNGDTVINSQDFFDFLTAFFAGC